MKKILIRAYTEDNLGDDMFVEYLCQRYPLIQFYIFCKECYNAAFTKIKNLNILNIRDKIDYIHFFLQIIIGGSIFMQSVNKTVLKKFLLDKKMINMGIPTIIIGANFGPYKAKTFLYLYKFLFSKIKYIVFRDKYSYELFNLNNMNWAPDILFNYNLPKVASKNFICISPIKKTKRSGLDDYNEFLYFEKLIEIAETYSKLGFKILLASFSMSQQDNVASSYIYDNLSQTTQSKTEMLNYTGNINFFLHRFLASTYIIGTRFHSIILGWNAGIPTFPICYNIKLQNAIDSYIFKGNYANICDINNINFSFFDANRHNVNLIDKTYLRVESKKHFYELDKLLME